MIGNLRLSQSFDEHARLLKRENTRRQMGQMQPKVAKRGAPK